MRPVFDGSRWMGQKRDYAKTAGVGGVGGYIAYQYANNPSFRSEVNKIPGWLIDKGWAYAKDRVGSVRDYVFGNRRSFGNLDNGPVRSRWNNNRRVLYNAIKKRRPYRRRYKRVRR